MKSYIVVLFIVASLLFCNCNSGHKIKGSDSKNTHGHVEGDGHVHDHSRDHSSGDGHSHWEDDGHSHSPDDGHDHHSADDGHDHDKQTAAHSDEILFTKEQAKQVGLITETVSSGTFSQVIKTSGRIQAAPGDEVAIVAASNGIVSFINPSMSVGASVKAGEAIVTVSAKNIQEGDPAVKAKAAYETALSEFKRAEELIKDNIISAKEHEQVKLRYETARTVYEAQSGNMTAEGVKVTSPVGGYLKNIPVRQGEYVSVGQIVAMVLRNKRLQLKAEVSENCFGSLKNISGANFRMAYGKTVYRLSDLNGRLLSFGRVVDGQSFFIPVTFEFDNREDIIPGSFAEVYLLSTPQDNIISVPVSALTEEQGLYFVYLQLTEEIYKKREVVIGQNNGERVQILSGLVPGEKVVTKGVYQVKLAAVSSVMPEGHIHNH